MHMYTLAAASLLALATGAQATVYDCKPLAVEGNSPFSNGAAINAKGQVAGVSRFADRNANSAALWKRPNRSQDLADSFAEETESSDARGLNDRGQVVGSVDFPCNETCKGDQPVLWEDGVPSLLPTLPGTGSAQANAINRKGRIVGQNFGDVTHAVLWRDGQAIDLGTLAPKDQQALTNSRARAINGDNVAVGSSQIEPGGLEQAVRWSPKGHITNLGTLPGGWGSEATSINGAGTIVGSSHISGGYHGHAVAWQDGQIIDLGTLTEGADSSAGAINDNGTVVGGEWLGEYYAALVWPSIHEPPQALKPLVANLCGGANDDFALDYATAINTSGVIVVNGYKGGVGWAGFVLTPR